MALAPDHCPEDPGEAAEAFSLGALSERDAAAFEEHLLTCAACRTAVEDADMFVRAMRAAAVQTRQAGKVTRRPR
jgi:anti-sigma factor RsiW